MPIAQTELLYRLIKSLDKSEKRHFKLYVSRLTSNKNGLFIQLFNLIDRSKNPDDLKFQAKLKLKSQNQYSNIKRHLYSQIIKSLRLLHISKNDSIRIREELDYASILYSKGLYDQCLLLLERIKPSAISANENILHLQILELQKKIESRHITRSRKIENRIEDLVNDSKTTRGIISRTSAVSDMSINVQGLYIKHGFAKNQRDIELYKSYFDSIRPKYDADQASFYEKILWYQSKVWYYYMCLDFEKSLAESISWLDHFNENEHMIKADPDLFMRGYHYVLTNSFYTGNRNVFEEKYEEYKSFRRKNYTQFNASSKLLDFGYFKNAQINSIILQNSFSGLNSLENEILEHLKHLDTKVDNHRKIMFYYKLAMANMYKGAFSKAVDHLNYILSEKLDHLRSDIFCYARLLHSICHYSLNNFDLLDSLLPSVKTSFSNAIHLNKSVENIINFLKKGSRAMNFGINYEIEELLKRLDKLSESKFERIPYIYFDFESWLKSLLLNMTIEKLKKILD